MLVTKHFFDSCQIKNAIRLLKVNNKSLVYYVANIGITAYNYIYQSYNFSLRTIGLIKLNRFCIRGIS